MTALARRAARGPWSGTIIDLMDLAGMVGAVWAAWRAFWKGVYALPMTAEELATFQRHTKRESPPTAPVAEAWMAIGRGGGKTRNSALHAVFRAITFDARTVDPGEDVVIPLLASDRRQARAALGYIRGFGALPAIAPYVFRGMLKEVIEFRTGVNIEVTTASKSAPRGYTCPTCCADEIAFWVNDEDGANPDHEVITAVRGSLGRVSGSVLLALSNPGAPKGELHDAVEQSFGKDDPDVLVWNADTLSMNATYDRRTIDRAFKKDPVVASSEFGRNGLVTFRQGRAALFDHEPVAAAIVTGRRELPPAPENRYVSFLDAAEGARSGDSITLAIAHKEGAVAVLDLVYEVEPPFDPGRVIVMTFAPILDHYGVRKLSGDRHAAGFVSSALRECGITFEPSKLSKSELYGELLPLVNTGMVELLDHPVVRAQMLALQRRSARGGRDSIDHPAGGHDDVVNAAAGALVLASGMTGKRKKRAAFSGSYDARNRRDPHAEMRDLIARTHRRLDAAAKADWEREQAAANEPMRATPVWRVHQN